MQDANLEDGDIVIIDSSQKPQSGDIVVCSIDGDFTIKIIEIHKDYIMLIPANKKFKPIKVTPEQDFRVFGIITYTIKNNKTKREKR